LGISDRYHFAWLRNGIEQFERQSGVLEAVRRSTPTPVIWCLGGQQMDRALGYVRDVLGRERTEVVFFDKFPRRPEVRFQDMNSPETLPDNACDVLMLIRASCFLSNPSVFLAHARRIIRPGGAMIVDWLHGCSDAPVLNLDADPGYGGTSTPFLTTYLDPQFLAEFPRKFEALIRHVNRPPSWANVARPGVPVPWAERLRRLLRPRAVRSVTLATYADSVRADLAAAGKNLVEPHVLEQHFKVVHRDAEYFYPMVRKFNLFLLTVLRPVGK
jgi:SAM-dependent methyltransferase